MKVAGVQHDITWEDRDANFAHLEPMVASAAGFGARLVVLTEMFATGFSMDAALHAEAEYGPSTRFLTEMAAAHGVWTCGSVAARRSGAVKPSNLLVLAAPDGTVHHYEKIHPFSYSREHEHYAAGDRFLTVEIDAVRCSFFVCYDLRFADEFWALAHETDCYVVVANWPESRRAHWRALLQARAIENQAYVVGVNRVGAGNRLAYVGDSMIVDPLGELLATAAAAETVISADVDPERVRVVRKQYPFLQDRR